MEAFGTMVVAYLFLGGTGAGTCFVLSGLGLLVPRDRIEATYSRLGRGRAAVAFSPSGDYRRLMAPGYVLGAGAAAVGALLLALDLGTIGKLGLLFLLPHATFVTVGAYALLVLIALGCVLASAWAVSTALLPVWAIRVCQAACLACAFVVMGYTGLLLSSLRAVPLWANAGIPVLFVASSLSCGCAMVLVCAYATGALSTFRTTARRMMRVDLLMLAVELIAAAAVLVEGLVDPHEVAVQGALSLCAGRLAAPFLAGFATVGIAVPAVLEVGVLVHKVGEKSAAMAAVAVLVGGLFLRYCIVAAGAHPAIWTVVA